MASGAKIAAEISDRHDPEKAWRLEAVAVQAIRQTLAEGKAKYQPGEWLGHELTEHVQHGAEHGRLSWEGPGNELREHLRHAICRLSMALALLEAK